MVHWQVDARREVEVFLGCHLPHTMDLVVGVEQASKPTEPNFQRRMR